MVRFLNPEYDVSAMRTNHSNAAPGDHFLVEFKLKPNAFDDSGLLFEVPGMIECHVRTVLEPRWPGAMYRDFDRQQHYEVYRKEEQPLRVLEAVLHMRSWKSVDFGWNELLLGIPVSLIENGTDGVFALCYTGAKFVFLHDGKLLDEIYPYGTVRAFGGVIDIAECVECCELHWTNAQPEIRYQPHDSNRPAQFYSPEFFNAWVGDVVPMYHDGRFHIFYLLDRRHHRSRFGCGSHGFAHLSSTDLENWTEHEPAVELTEQWQSVGTGVPFFHRGKYYFVHGWHTSRQQKIEDCFYQILADEFKAKRFHPIPTASRPDLYPCGATYWTSDDCIHFTPSRILIQAAENPSVYPQKDGTLLMIASNGSWRADSIESDWTPFDPNFPQSGPDSPMHNSDECPSLFEWNSFRYLIMGITGFWSAKPGGEYENTALDGYDVYDGLAVPMAAPFRDNRMILSGWFDAGSGFASLLIFRELIQYPSGRLGMKWLEEVMPRHGSVIQKRDQVHSGTSLELKSDADSYLEMMVDPGSGTGTLELRFSGAPNGSVHEFRLDFARERLQFSTTASLDDSGPVLLPFKEAMEANRDHLGPGCAWGTNIPSKPWNCCDFALGRVDVMKQPFRVRICRHVAKKIPATIFDIEIAGQRTMLSARRTLGLNSVRFVSDDSAVKVTELCETAWA